MYWRMLMLKIKSAISQLSTLWRRDWGVFACSLIGMDDTDHHLLGEDDKNQTVILLTPFTLSIYPGLWRYMNQSFLYFLTFLHTWDHHTVMTKLNFGKKKRGGSMLNNRRVNNVPKKCVKSQIAITSESFHSFKR